MAQYFSKDCQVGQPFQPGQHLYLRDKADNDHDGAPAQHCFYMDLHGLIRMPSGRKRYFVPQVLFPLAIHCNDTFQELVFDLDQQN
ncbi:hypothetical protein D3C80_1389490 [compost metagenome]